MRIIDGDELVMWLSKWMVSSFGTEPTEETEAIRKVCDAVGDMVKELERENKDGDLISRQAALKVACDTCQFVSCPDDDKCDEYEAMKNLPSAEPKIGLWIRDDVGVITCSECGRPRRDNRINHIKYCNSCGARMKGW